MRAKILVGVALHNPDHRFQESLLSFLKNAKEKYDIECIIIYGKTLVNAQNDIANYFMNDDYGYLLMCEDDHWGHSVDMLDSLFNPDVEVSAINYYSRHFPYYSCLMHELKNRPMAERFAGLHYTSGYYECDLAGFAMMLIKRSVFDKLDKPYFRENKESGPGSYATDIDFSDRLKEKGISILGCFDHTLAHRDVSLDNIADLRRQGVIKGRNDKIMSIALKKMEKGK